MIKILIDTDVLIDVLFDRKPFSDHSSGILALCEKKNIRGFVTPVIISNLYYLLRKAASHKETIDKLKYLLRITDVLTMNKDIVIKALFSEFKDFEDGLQHYSAMYHGDINVIVTRNLKDYKPGNIAAMTPEIFLRSRQLL